MGIIGNISQHTELNVNDVRGARSSSSGIWAKTGGKTLDTVEISPQGKILAQLSEMQEPNEETLARLSEDLGRRLYDAFEAAGISDEAHLELEIDPASGNVIARGGEPDASKATAVLKENPDLQVRTRLVSWVKERIVTDRVVMGAITGYQNATNHAEHEAVYRQYNSLYQNHDRVIDVRILYTDRALHLTDSQRR